MSGMQDLIAIRGGGDLASGVGLRLHRAGFPVLVLEQTFPQVVRRKVAFAEAVFLGQTQVEEVISRLIQSFDQAAACHLQGEVPVLVQPEEAFFEQLQPRVIVDARMLKQAVPSLTLSTDLLVGLGPGFTVGMNCHAVIETMRGHHLGRVFWEGSASANTGVPGSIAKHKLDRILRAPADGLLENSREIGEQIKQGELIAKVAGQPLVAPFDGVLRGLIHPSVPLVAGMKIGDLDPRNDPTFVSQVSDKSLAIGGAVLEAILSHPHLRILNQHA